MRINIIRVLIIAVFLLILMNLFYLQVIRGRYFYRLSHNNSIRVIPFEGERGKILDRNGKVLAESEKAYHAVIIPQDMGKRRDVFGFLSGCLGEPSEEIERRYRRNKLTPFSPVSVAEGITRQQAIKIEENSFRFPGLMVIERYRRKYSLAKAGAHALGYVGKVDPARMREIASYGYSAEDVIGYSGIEQGYDDVLRAATGGREIEVNSRGQQTRLLQIRESTKGRDVMLTLDAFIQRVAQDALGGARGSVVILDPDTGEILAMASSPSFDPNAFTHREERNRVAEYLEDSASPLLNRAITGSFPPGSVFKIPVAIAGLEEKKITPFTSFNCPGYFELGDRIFKSPHVWGIQDLTQAMGHSANEYFFHVGLLLGPEMIERYARLMGLGQRTGIDLPYEAKGRIPSRVDHLRWFKGDTVNMSIGQGNVLTTPLQLARMIAVFANGGYLVTPRIVKNVDGAELCVGADTDRLLNGRESRVMCGASKVRIMFREDTWKILQKVLYAPVRMETGTAHILDLPGLDTFGKTGTAQAGAGKMDHAWFVGVTASSKRRIAYSFFFENGGSSANACAAMKEILLRLQEKGVL
ncbi:MAG: penicillin-binding protein 2 [Candidatus Omnitrophica bacterium]|nr:penicillin-binding protein 2 [Candidatus Omnitrophota bacterium]